MSRQKPNESGQKLYEIAFILDNPASQGGILELLKRYKAHTLFESPVNELKLAYPIKKRTAGYFGYIQFNLEPAEVEKIDKTLKLDKSILRFLIITTNLLKKKIERKTEPKKYVKNEEAPKTTLTNEALEETLEEILK